MSSVIFIGSPHKSNRHEVCLKQLFFVSPYDIIVRIFRSFIPPYNSKYQKVHVDLLGPLLGFIILTAFVTYGNSLKLLRVNITPVEFLCIYSFLMPIICYLLTHLAQSSMTLYETVALVGYAYYGHFATLVTSFMWFQKENNFIFFVCLIFFGGLSTLRMTMVILGTIPVPAARLLVCTTISIFNILCLVFLHFAFMHRTFVYSDTDS
nr:unnamed protein product [Callosobruchus analis]